MASVNAQLQSLRDEWGGFGDETFHFTVRVLGGQWSVNLRRKLTTDIGAYSKDKATGLWCKAVGWPMAKSFAVAKYGLHNARVLSEEMCRLGNYFLGAWTAAGNPTPFSFDHLKGAYQSPPEYLQWFEGLPLNSDAIKAAFLVRDLCPGPVPP